MGRLKVAVFASGGGSNLQSLIDASKNEDFPGEISTVISNNSKSYALERARIENISDYHISGVKYPDISEFKDKLISILDSHSINLIVLAGYMKLLPPQVTEKYRNRIINIHPALLPKHGGKGMYGMNVHNAVIEAGEEISGATVHFVDEKFDNGATLIQRTVPVFPDDTAEILAARVLKIEHKILPQAVGMFL